MAKLLVRYQYLKHLKHLKILISQALAFLLVTLSQAATEASPDNFEDGEPESFQKCNLNQI